MSRAGFRVIDADCHIVESKATIDDNIDSAFREQLRAFDQPALPFYIPNKVSFNRLLGTHGDSAQASSARMLTVPRWTRDPHPDTNTDPAARLADMDMEGIDVGVLISSTVTSFSSVDDVGLESATYAAYNRFLDGFCSAQPKRLAGAMVVGARDVPGAVAEMKRWTDKAWAVAVLVSLAPGQYFDDPDFDPIWATAAASNLTIALHSFTTQSPYAPGARDGSYYDNSWIARAAAHSWCGQRNMASLLGSGVLDRHPDLRIAVLESGHGWLPFWVRRLDEQADYLPHALPESTRRIADYVTEGRYFQTIEVSEGEAATAFVMQELGQNILTFATDYPHGETWFPKTVDAFLSWSAIDDTGKERILSTNALSCYPRLKELES